MLEVTKYTWSQVLQSWRERVPAWVPYGGCAYDRGSPSRFLVGQSRSGFTTADVVHASV